MSNSNNNSGGIGFLGLLTIVFITLKLTKFIDWSWWLVLLPAYFWIAVILIFMMIAGLASLFDNTDN